MIGVYAAILLISFIIGVVVSVRKIQKQNGITARHLAEYKALSGCTDDELATDKGTKGEFAIYKTLRKMDPTGRVVVNLYLPYRGGTSEVDLVYVHKTGVYVIESKNYSGKIYGFEKAKSWSQYLGGQKYPFYNPIKQNSTHINALAAEPGILKEHMRSYIVFGSNAILQKVTVSKDSPPVLLLQDLPKRIKKDMSSRKTVYSDNEVKTLANDLWKNYGLANDTVKSDHITAIHAKYGTA